ncbi:MAG: carboxyl transferase, partial [Oscillospiraceae bacterium]|nr:carboxyl transferase [Oscillospiraceae bacterium]
MMTESQKTKLAEYNSAKSSCPARDRLAALYDDGAFTEVGSGVKTGVVTAYGYIGGCPAYAFSQDKTV